jgi:alpha-tubulin suppressor-like RCC1 family protein
MGSGIASATHSTFTKITTLSDIVDIAAGGYTHTTTSFPGTTSTSVRAFCAAIQEKDDTKHLFVWGYNGNGQLGTGNKTNVAAPVELTLSFEPGMVACGAAHMAVLSKGGNWYITGYQKGLGLSADQTEFVQVDESRVYAEIACGRDVSYALNTDNKIYAVGTKTNGSMLGENSTAEPILLVDNMNIQHIYSSGDCYGCAFTVAEGAVAGGGE